MAFTAGVDVLVKTRVGGVMTAIGAQSGATLNRSAATIDVTNKNSNGWAASIAGVKSWSVDCEAFVLLGDSAMEVLFTAFDARTPIEIEIRVGATTDTSGYTYTGQAFITDFPEDYKQDGAVSIKMSLAGATPLVRTIGSVPAPTAVTATISAPATTGFTLGLSPAVTGITAANLVIKNQEGTVLTPTSVSTSNAGATYTVLVTLPASQVATVTITKDGYDFGYMKVIVVA